MKYEETANCLNAKYTDSEIQGLSYYCASFSLSIFYVPSNIFEIFVTQKTDVAPCCPPMIRYKRIKQFTQSVRAADQVLGVGSDASHDLLAELKGNSDAHTSSVMCQCLE